MPTASYEIIPFGDHHIMTVQQSGSVFVVMKPIAEQLGLQWEAQLKRIKRHPVLSKGMSLMDIPSAGGIQEATTLQLEQFHGWLVTLSPDRISDTDRREVIIRYQERCFRVIFEHFHGSLAGKSQAALAMQSRIAAQNQIMRMMTRLRRTDHPAERRTIHAMLATLCEDIGVVAPTIEELGQDALPPPDLCRQFWIAFDQVRGRRAEFDHSRKAGVLAINLQEIAAVFRQARIDVAIDAEMRAALRHSTGPRFIEAKTVNSRLTGGTRHCWVFSEN